MNPYQYPTTCSVCGEEALGHVKDAGCDWLGGIFTHKDPLVCISNMERSKRKKQREILQSQIVAEGAGI